LNYQSFQPNFSAVLRVEFFRDNGYPTTRYLCDIKANTTPNLSLFKYYPTGRWVPPACDRKGWLSRSCARTFDLNPAQWFAYRIITGREGRASQDVRGQFCRNKTPIYTSIYFLSPNYKQERMLSMRDGVIDGNEGYISDPSNQKDVSVLAGSRSTNQVFSQKAVVPFIQMRQVSKGQDWWCFWCDSSPSQLTDYSLINMPYLEFNLRPELSPR
jgi:hypothetical protein